MVDPINLNRARKARAKAEAKASAAANRVKFGRTAAQKSAEAMAAARREATIEGHRREGPADEA